MAWRTLDPQLHQSLPTSPPRSTTCSTCRATSSARSTAATSSERLKGKNIAIIFEKTSTRTRVAFEVAAYDQGAHVTYLEPSGTQIGHKESIKDTARVLGRIYDGIEYRGFDQEIVESLASTPACRSGTA